jgi:RNA polymerase sigma-70 factor (ECF subfamily)
LTRQEFKYLFDTHFEQLRSYIFYRGADEALASDIAQEAYIKFWEKNADFNEKKNLGLLYKMAHDLFIDAYRKKKLANKYAESLDFSWHNISPENEAEYKELASKYKEALQEMKEEQRIAFLMNRRDELSYSEIAERLDLSVKAIEKRISKALAFLRQKLNINDR